MLAPWIKVYDKSRQHIKKKRHYWGRCESWTIKKAEWQRTDAFELWCWRRLLRVPWTARRSNQSILKEINPEYSLEGLMLKLKLQNWSPDAKNWLTGKDPDVRKDWKQEKGDNRGWDVWMASLTQWTWALASPWRWQRRGKPGCVLQFMGSQRVGHDWVTEQQQSSPPTPYPWNVYLTCLLWSQKLPHRYSLEVAIWCFEPTDDICDWTQLRPLFKLLGLAGMYRDSLGLWLPKII